MSLSQKGSTIRGFTVYFVMSIDDMFFIPNLLL